MLSFGGGESLLARKVCKVGWAAGSRWKLRPGLFIRGCRMWLPGRTDHEPRSGAAPPVDTGVHFTGCNDATSLRTVDVECALSATSGFNWINVFRCPAGHLKGFSVNCLLGNC